MNPLSQAGRPSIQMETDIRHGGRKCDAEYNMRHGVQDATRCAGCDTAWDGNSPRDAVGCERYLGCHPKNRKNQWQPRQKAVFGVLYDMVRAKIKSNETKLTLHTCSKHGSRESKTYPLCSLRSDRLQSGKGVARKHRPKQPST
jgi:hypothetical protein